MYEMFSVYSTTVQNTHTIYMNQKAKSVSFYHQSFGSLFTQLLSGMAFYKYLN